MRQTKISVCPNIFLSPKCPVNDFTFLIFFLLPLQPQTLKPFSINFLAAALPSSPKPMKLTTFLEGFI